MPSIITLTFSPCIDKSTSVPALVPEKKLHCAAPRLEPGGGGINVARAVKKLGGEALAIFPSGGCNGREFHQLLEVEDVASLVIPTAQETRENFIVVDAATNNQYRFGMPGTPLLEAEWRQCLEAVEGIASVDYVVASGSLPPGVPNDIYARLARIAKAKNARLIVDTSGEPLRQAAGEGVFLLKPNLGELAALTGSTQLQPDDICQVAAGIIAKGGCGVVVVSMGAAGAMLVTDTYSEIITPPPVTRKSTVGAGDSMVAGIVYALITGKSIREAARYGVACGTAATMNAGTELCRKADADYLYSLVKP